MTHWGNKTDKDEASSLLELLARAEKITESGSFDWNIQTGKIIFSDGMYAVMGQAPGTELSRELIRSMIHPDDAKALEELLAELDDMHVNSSTVAELRLNIKEGSLRHIWVRCSAVCDQENKLVRIIGAVQDITERKRQETLTEVIYNISQAASNLTDFKEFYTVIQQEINQLVDANNMFVAFYDESKDLLDIQYVTGEPSGLDFVPAEGTISKLVITENCSLLLNNTTLLDFDTRGKIKRIGRSSKTWLGVPLRKGNIPFGVLVVQNYERDNAFNEEDQELLEFISIQLVSAIRSMKDSEQINVLTNSIKQSPVSVVITNKEGDIEYVNPKFEQVTGYSLAEIHGQNPRFLKSGANPRELYKTLWDTILDGQEWRGEFQNKRKDGSFYWELASISAVKNNIGEISHFVAVKEDITERKELEKDLILAKEKAEESDKLKTAFLANLSHEIRTPMNGILGFSELLREPDLSPDELNKYVNIINSNSNQLLGIIDDIITVSNLEVKQLKINLRQFSLGYFLEEISLTIEMERKYIEKEHIEIIFPEKNYKDLEIEADEGKIHQVLINFLKNALKFTNSGTVRLDVSFTADSMLTFEVSDTGIGISPENREVIFVRFRQVDESNTRSFGGTGLGLAISKGLVELMGGNIWLKSSLGKGAVFGFSIPVKHLK